MKTFKKSKHPRGACRARKRLEKFGYSVLDHMGALFQNLGLVGKAQVTSDRTSKVQIYRGVDFAGSCTFSWRLDPAADT